MKPIHPSLFYFHAAIYYLAILLDYDHIYMAILVISLLVFSYIFKPKYNSNKFAAVFGQKIDVSTGLASALLLLFILFLDFDQFRSTDVVYFILLCIRLVFV